VPAGAEQLLEEWEEEDRELRELRRNADWRYIESLPPSSGRRLSCTWKWGDVRLA